MKDLQDPVYLLRSGDVTVQWNGLMAFRYKIGESYNPRHRKGQLQTGNPDPLIPIATFFGGQPLETFLKTAFDDRRGLGEWFHFSDNHTAVCLVHEKVEEYTRLRVEHPTLRPSVLAKLAAKVATMAA